MPIGLHSWSFLGRNNKSSLATRWVWGPPATHETMFKYKQQINKQRSKKWNTWFSPFLFLFQILEWFKYYSKPQDYCVYLYFLSSCLPIWLQTQKTQHLFCSYPSFPAHPKQFAVQPLWLFFSQANKIGLKLLSDYLILLSTRPRTHKVSPCFPVAHRA